MIKLLENHVGTVFFPVKCTQYFENVDQKVFKKVTTKMVFFFFFFLDHVFCLYWSKFSKILPNSKI